MLKQGEAANPDEARAAIAAFENAPGVARRALCFEDEDGPVCVTLPKGARVQITTEEGHSLAGVVERGTWTREDGWRIEGQREGSWAGNGYFYWVQRAEPGTVTFSDAL